MFRVYFFEVGNMFDIFVDIVDDDLGIERRIIGHGMTFKFVPAEVIVL